MSDEQKYDAGEIEARWRAQWEAWGIYRYDPSQPRDNTFAVDTPPPTVSGSLHVGHAFSYTHQDLLVRYQRMRGRNIFFPMGWDDNGLPTERRVENLFNVRCDPRLPYQPDFTPAPEGKGPSTPIGRTTFIELCGRATAQDEAVYKEMWQRLGLSIDWSLEYATINDRARRICQLSLLGLYQKGEMYATDAPMYWDPTFRTAIAQAEIEDREAPAHFYRLRFPLAGSGACEIATTRPELLAACVALMVHPDDDRYRHLIGQTALTPVFRVPVPIHADQRVQKDKGTGVVMVCTFGDITDVQWWREYRLPTRPLINRAGRIDAVHFGTPGWPSEAPEQATAAVAQLAGTDLTQARSRMADLLRQEGHLIGELQPLSHAVKFYEKGNRPLEILLTRQWFIRLLDKREQLVEQGDCIEWHPSFMRERYRNWVQGLNQDWCISRQRFFGVPFPIWYPLDASGKPLYEQPIFAEANRLPVDPMSDVPPGYQPEQRNQPGGFVGESDVLDTWATSSLTPQLTTGWVLDPERSERLFPMDVRPQSHEIIRTWAFYTIAMAWMHQRSVPWRHVVISGWILDPDRKKMSKSKGNVVTPVHLLDSYSADGVRYWAARARPGVDTAYDENIFKIGKRLVTKLFNAARFVGGCLDKAGSLDLSPEQISEELDRGLVARLRTLIREVSTAYDALDWATPLLTTESFFWAEFCDDYLEMVKERAYREPTDAGRRSALASLRLTLSVLLRLFAPTLPYVTEDLWARRFATSDGLTRSIHTSSWPTEAELANVPTPQDADSYANARLVLAEVRRAKGAENRTLRWPVQRLVVDAPQPSAGLRAALADVCSAGVVRDLELRQAEKLTSTVLLANQENG